MSKIHTFLLSTALIFISSLPLLSSSTHAVSEEEVRDNLKKRLQETVIAASPSPTPITYKSLVGVIRDVIKDTLVIQDKDGEKNIRLASGSALVRSPGNANIKSDDIRLDDYAIAIGHFIADDELESIRLVVSTEPLTSSSKISGLATITKITKTTLTVSSGNGEGEIKSLLVDTKTVLKSPVGDSLDLTDLQVGDSLLYTGTVEKDSIKVTNIMRIGFAAAPSPTN